MGDWLKKLDLSEAEIRLLEECSSGSRLVLGDGTRPSVSEPSVTIRASFIRALLLDQVDGAYLIEKGLRLKGAWISGTLDLQGVECRHDLALTNTVLEATPNLLSARMRGLFLNGSLVPGFSADGASFDGSVYLRNGFVSTSEISLPGVKIKGDLQICDAELSGAGRASVFAASLRVDGNIFLGDYPFDEIDSELRADGALIFLSANIGQDFYCRNCALTAHTAILGKAVSLEGEEGRHHSAFSLARATVGGVLYMKHNQIAGGSVNLSDARVRRLNDEPAGEGAAYRIRLDGFDYHEFAQDADASVGARLNWLSRRPDSVEFSAQPYEHLARVLGKIGHQDDARQILIAKETMQRAANIKAIRDSGDRLWRIPFHRVWNSCFRFLVGYGYRPMLSMIWGAILIIVLSFFFSAVWRNGDMAPNAAPILVSKGWVEATQSHPGNPAEYWASKGQAGQDYETFHAVAYSADLLIPIVTLGQEAAWAPSTSRGPLGRVAWWIRWFVKIIGWVLTAMTAAAVTGVIRRD